ncbi:uncharacterized protein LAJ45_01060 [Morchella importuna]|uniref:Uncharacterized protein n=1 Tax=Morchella conica CCBAS932 TaxID=1392247 RepID=A0A3N4KP43_9PEZI|nr:uncharacterized protein LAJ45_01060 [Morchella importuna]KAH8154532.1 hypothetical protein LAJ45_01060 [Morchella importuna]RPB12297.1 hypothetical protein P167DRAFT_545528 [Morchella conica CCBAS932]
MADEPTNWENYKAYTDHAHAKFSRHAARIDIPRRRELKLDAIADRLVRLGVRADEYNLKLAHGSLSATLLQPDFERHVGSKYDKLAKDVADLVVYSSAREKENEGVKAILDCAAGILTHVNQMRDDLYRQLESSSRDLRWGLNPVPRTLRNRRQMIDMPINTLVVEEARRPTRR